MENKVNKFMYWTPRILSIIFIGFLSLFSLDVFDMGLGPWETALGLLMHNIPALILLIALIISWKREIVGGIVFTLAGIFYVVMMLGEISGETFKWGMILPLLIIALPALIIGTLFIVNWLKRRQ